MSKETYKIELNHEDIRREMDNYINHAKALGLKIGGGYGEFSAYVQLIQTVTQIEHNKQVEWEAHK